MTTSGQTINDRLNAARYALAGQGLARCVCKATTEEIIGPKKKHLEYLVACTHEPNVSIPQLANLLIERTNHIYWVVVFKALVTVHHLMSYGNERFTQYLASSNYSFELSTFLDKTSAHDYSMSTFIRRYSRYINEKALSYRLLAFDFCKVKRGPEGVLRLMPIDRLLKTLPILESQLDALLEFDCRINDLNNGVINACFMLLFRDLIGLFACHNDGIITVLNKYFTLNKKMCREAFEHYKKFLVRMDKVSEFLRVVEEIGIDKNEIPELRRAPSSLIDALENHLKSLESKKQIRQISSSSMTSDGGNKSGDSFSALGNLTPPPSNSLRSNSPNSSGSTAVIPNASTTLGDEFAATSFRDDEVRRALEEEARVLMQYGGDVGGKVSKTNGGAGTSRSSTGGSSSNTGSNSPKFAVSTIPKSILDEDIFGDSDTFGSTTNGNGTNNQIKDNNNSSVFDNLGAVSGTNNTTAKNRPDLDSIRSAIQSATSTLEKSNSLNISRGTAEVNNKSAPPKKPSDELWDILQKSPVTLEAAKPQFPATASFQGPAPPVKNLFDEPRDPFTDCKGFEGLYNSDIKPVAPTVVSNNNPMLKPATVAPNYTNLGGLEGFGDLLQPMSSSNNKNSNPNSSQGGQPKPSFNSGSGLSSTGLFKGDLDSTLANIAQNLTFEGITKTKK